MASHPPRHLPALFALALALFGTTAGFPRAARAIETLPDAGWWSSCGEAQPYWKPERLQRLDDQVIAYAYSGGPQKNDETQFHSWRDGRWTALPAQGNTDAGNWCVWRHKLIALVHRPGFDEVRTWEGGDWQAFGGTVQRFSGPLVAVNDRLLLASPTGLYEWLDGDWRRLGPETNITQNFVLLLRGEPVVVDPSSGGVQRLRAGQWQRLESIPTRGLLLPRPVVVGGRLYAAKVDFAPLANRGVGQVLRLEGDHWAPVGDEVPGVITALFDDQGQPGVATGLFDVSPEDDVTGVAGFLMGYRNGAWTPTSPFLNGGIADVVSVDDAPVAAGYYTVAGEIAAPGIARLVEGAWRPMEEVPIGGADGIVHSLLSFRGDLVVAGGFLTLGGQVASGIARGDGVRWRPLGGGMDDAVFATTEYQGDLIAGGAFMKAGAATAACVARWDGAAWHALGEGFDDRVQALALYHGELYAGGWFKRSGATDCAGIARWNGAAWEPVAGGVDAYVNALTVFGDALVAGGEFKNAGGAPAHYLAGYDGAVWRAFPAEVSSNVMALTVWNDRLVVGGMFRRAGNIDAPAVAFWDGASWSAPTADAHPYRGWAVSFGTYLGDLVVGWARGGAPAPSPNNNFALWDGHDWRVPETVSAGDVRAVMQFGNSLFIGGEFSTAGGHPVQNIARWDGALVTAPLVGASSFRSGAAAELTWTAIGVSNHSGYEIWRESGAGPRSKLGFVAALPDGHYAFSDAAPLADAADYWLRELGPLGSEEWLGPIPLAPLPPGVQLRVPTPNPFRARTTLTFTLARPGRIGIGVYDVQGRHVRTLLDEARSAGIYTQEWDGRDVNGGTVASGFYWLRLDSDAGSAAQRVLFLR